jgi:competence protein ComEC
VAIQVTIPLPISPQVVLWPALFLLLLIFFMQAGNLRFFLLLGASFLLGASRTTPALTNLQDNEFHQQRPVAFSGQILEKRISDQGGFEGVLQVLHQSTQSLKPLFTPKVPFHSRHNMPTGVWTFHGVVEKKGWGWSISNLVPYQAQRNSPQKSIPLLPRARNALRNRLEEKLSSKEAGIARALLLGESSAVDSQRWSTFRFLGLLHLLAVSGMHFWLWDSILRRLLPRKLAFLRPPVLLFAGAMAGFRAPVIRALSALFIRDCLHRKGMQVHAFYLWAAALWVECSLLSPRPQGLGLVLSYSATAALIWVNQVKGEKGMLTVLRSSLAASLATSPWLLAVQGTLEPWSVLLTPPMALLLPVRMVGALMTCIPGFLGEVSSQFLEAFGALENLFLNRLNSLPASPIIAPRVPFAAWTIFSFSIVAIMGLPIGILKQVCRALAVSTFLVILVFPRQGKPGVALLPVGHGLAVIVSGKQNSLIFDLGSTTYSPEDLLRRKLWPFLRAQSWPTPHQWTSSHQDHDHAGALHLLKKHHGGTSILRSGDKKTPILRMEPFEAMLWHCPDRMKGESNAGGRVLEITAPQQRMLVLGDQFGHDLRWLCQVLKPGPIDVLVLPHHGRTTDGLPELLDHLQPKAAWVSCSESKSDLEATPLLQSRGIPMSLTREGPLIWSIVDKIPSSDFP